MLYLPQVFTVSAENGHIPGGKSSQLQRHHHCFKESLTKILLEGFLETHPSMPELILTLSIYYHIILLLIFTYQDKIPLSSSRPKTYGGERQVQAQGTIKRRNKNSTVHKGKSWGLQERPPSLWRTRSRSQLLEHLMLDTRLPALLTASVATARLTMRSRNPMGLRLEGHG